MWVTHHFVGSKALVSHLATVGSNEGHDSGYHQNHQDGSRVVSAEMHGCLCWQSAGPEPECEHIRTGAHSSEPQSGASAAH